MIPGTILHEFLFNESGVMMHYLLVSKRIIIHLKLIVIIASGIVSWYVISSGLTEVNSTEELHFHHIYGSI